MGELEEAETKGVSIARFMLGEAMVEKGVLCRAIGEEAEREGVNRRCCCVDAELPLDVLNPGTAGDSNCVRTLPMVGVDMGAVVECSESNPDPEWKGEAG